MLPPLSAQCMSVLDYLADATEHGEEVFTRDAMACIYIPERSARRVSLRLAEYGLVVRDRRKHVIEKTYKCAITGRVRTQTDTKTCTTIRITPLGRRLIDAYYRSATPAPQHEAAK